MLDSIIGSTTIPLLEQMARFGERRQEVLAGNLANIDTPGYRMRDLPVEKFHEALRQAVASGRSQHGDNSLPLSASQSSRAPIPGGAATPYQPSKVPAPPLPAAELFPDSLFQAVESPPQNLTFQDANNRSIEVQSMQMVRNAMLQQYAVEVMNSQLRMLEVAISESVLT